MSKLVPLFLFFSYLFLFHNTVKAELSLNYKTIEGLISVSGLDGKKPYSLQEGKRRYLHSTGVFEIDGTLEEIAAHASFPVLFSRQLDFKTSKIVSPDGTSKRNYRHSVGLHSKFSSSSHLGLKLYNPLYSEIQEIWGSELPENFLLIVAWLSKDSEVHRVNELTFLNQADLDSMDQWGKSNFDIDSYQKLIPVVLLFSENGEFVPLLEHSKHQYLADYIPMLIRDDADQVEAYFSENLSLLKREFLGVTPIHYAAAFDSDKSMQVLIDFGSKTQKRSHCMSTPLHICSNAANVESLSVLLRAGAKSKFDFRKNTPLHYAAALGHSEIVKRIVESGAKKNSKNSYYHSPLFLAAKYGNGSIVQYLYEAGVKYKFPKDRLQMLLLRAIARDDIETVEFLISKGANPKKELRGAYPITMAAEKSSSHLIKLLVECGADVNVFDSENRTPLMIASSRDLDRVVALVESGAEINAQSEGGVTALHLAVLKHQIDISQYLLDHGADPNARNPDGTPLVWLATSVGNRIGLNTLIEAGAVCDMNPETALPIMEYAFRFNIPEIVEITLADCLVPDFRFRNDIPAYWVADYYGSIEVKEILCRYGIDPSKIENPEFLPPEQVLDQLKLVKKGEFTYPPALQQRYGEFFAKVMLIVDYDGSVIFPKIVDNPCVELSRSILDSSSQMKFEPILIDGKSMRTRFIYPVKFIPSGEDELVYEVKDVQRQPRPIKTVKARYPKSLINSNISGTVMLLIVVDEEGNVSHAEVESATHNLFIDPSLAAIKHWKFTPGTVGGKNVKVRARIPLEFSVF